MRFEKLNENKIRIILTSEDLITRDIDFHSFMSNSAESQDLFLDMLEKAEKEIGFVTKDYLIRIEALVMSGGNFVFIVTRTPSDIQKNNYKKKVHIKRKNTNLEANNAIYSFANFEDFCKFLQFFKDNFKSLNIGKKIILYEYKNIYYLLISEINFDYNDLKKFFSAISEFANFTSNSEIFERKLIENGNNIIKHNAISIGIRYFTK